MKKTFYLLVLAIVAGFVMLGVPSCRKEAEDSPYTSQQHKLIAESRSFYEQEIKASYREDASDLNVKEMKPDWSHPVFLSQTDAAFKIKEKKSELIELLVVKSEKSLEGAIKHYEFDAGKLSIYSLQGKLVVSGDYDVKTLKFTPRLSFQVPHRSYRTEIDLDPVVINIPSLQPNFPSFPIIIFERPSGFNYFPPSTNTTTPPSGNEGGGGTGN